MKETHSIYATENATLLEGSVPPLPRMCNRLRRSHDSTVAYKEGWGPAFERMTEGSLKVINRAKNGGTLETTSGQMDKLLQKKPDYVLIQFGHNDMWRYDDEVYAAKLTEYIERTRAAGSKAVVLRRKWGQT